MISNLQQVKKAAIQFLNSREIEFSSIGNISFYAKDNQENKHQIDYWVVPYTYMVFQEESAYIHIDDATQQVMYVLTKHGYIDPNKKKEDLEEDDNDGESWNDL